MSGYQFERECRTSQSECYIVELDDEEVGRVDIHYTNSVAYATLCVPESMTDEDIRELISEVDERLVLTTDPFRRPAYSTTHGDNRRDTDASSMQSASEFVYVDA